MEILTISPTNNETVIYYTNSSITFGKYFFIFLDTTTGTHIKIKTKYLINIRIITLN